MNQTWMTKKFNFWENIENVMERSQFVDKLLLKFITCLQNVLLIIGNCLMLWRL